ncbi:MarR family transcriptional regulator [Amycolatopsis sp. AA4]|uniref:MarR family winged helix-turn-helix transcriptional regulator n=1 Tax=Actinomycetes TaxID=1760 RepID=UPI0001B56AC2|nr:MULTISPECIES: MarR family transcriptional regulator [Actinomycetes]ATY11758.1 MarR family transcriptional regulator [Amycolatopsis sp. AA4]EFL07425.1 MarR family transcriptional regulator [Streptomyces sp. AA4]
MDELRPPTLLALPSYLAGHVARIGRRELADALETYGLRLPHFAVLAGLSDFGPLAQHALADRLGLNRSHLVGYLDELERRSLVGRERDSADRRRHRVALTEAGKALTRELKAEASRSQDVFLAELSASERETLISLLRRVVVADARARSGAGAAG